MFTILHNKTHLNRYVKHVEKVRRDHKIDELTLNFWDDVRDFIIKGSSTWDDLQELVGAKNTRYKQKIKRYESDLKELLEKKDNKNAFEKLFQKCSKSLKLFSLKLYSF